MKINGKEFEFDIADADCMERYEKALQIIQEESKNAKLSGAPSEKLKVSCQLVFNFFDEVLGRGAADKIFEGKMNFRTCFEVYEQFIDDCSESCQSLTQKLSKYSSNRAQRRA